MKTRMEEQMQRTAGEPAVAMPLPAAQRRVERQLSAGQIAWVIRRERARADRTGKEFSLVLFRTAGGAADLRAVRQLGRILEARVRGTDEVGCHEDGWPCAVLADTGPLGAACLARGVCAAAKQQGV